MSFIDIDKWQEIYLMLKNNKLRTFLTVFGVSWGIFMLIIMLGAGKGLENSVVSGFDGWATNRIVMWTQRTTIPYKGFPQGRYFWLRTDDIEPLRNNIPEIEYIAPRIQYYGGYRGSNNVTRGKQTGNFTIFGDYPIIGVINPINITQGRFINELDIQNKRKVAIIGKRVAEILFEPTENPIGEYIEIQGIFFKVVGLFDSKSRGGDAERETQTIYLPFTSFQKAFNYGNVVGWIALTAKENIPASVVEEKAQAVLAARHKVHPDDKQAFGGWNMQEQFQKMTGLFTWIRWIVWFVGTGTLLAGVIGVSNIMLIVVRERTREFGIKRAIGAAPMTIISQIVTETIFLTAFAGIIGLMLGVGLIELVNNLLLSSGGVDMFKNPEVRFEVAIIAVIVLIVSGAFAGLIPARRAINIKPVEALKEE